MSFSYEDACSVVQRTKIDVMLQVEDFDYRFLDEGAREFEWGWYVMVLRTFPEETGRGQAISHYYVDAKTEYCTGTMGGCSEFGIAEFLKARDQHATRPSQDG